MGVREDLFELEKEYASRYETATGNKSNNKSFGYLKNLRDGDLYKYIQKLYSGSTGSQSKSGIERRKWYKEHGYSPLEFLDSRIDELDLEDSLCVEDLRPGQIFNRFEISALADDYNDQKGMYSSRNASGQTIALCVSTPDNIKQYEDHWITPGETYFYNMQDEHTPATGLSFKKKVNKILFKDFEESRLSERPRVPVYLFVHDLDLKKKMYRFEGIFYVNSLPSLDAFEFVKGDLPLTKELRESRKKAVERIANMKGSELVGDRKIIHMHQFNPSRYITKLVEEYTEALEFVSREEEKRDYIQKQRLATKIGTMGEELVLKYEKDYVAKNVPGKENDVKLAADSMGYDIRTFRKEGDRIIEIHIEVKTTSDEDPYSKFYMSDHEKWFMENHADTYWLYRIYDVYSENIKGVYLKGDVAKHIAMNPSNYVCALKGRSPESDSN